MQGRKQFLKLNWIIIFAVIGVAFGCGNEGEVASSDEACVEEAIQLQQTIDSLIKDPGKVAGNTSPQPSPSKASVYTHL